MIWQLSDFSVKTADNHTPRSATNTIAKMSTADKNELLFRYNINFNDLPSWQKRGIGIYWAEMEKAGINPITGEQVVVKRRQLYVNQELPIKDEYNCFIQKMIEQSEQ